MGCLESKDCLILGIDCSTRYTAVGYAKGDRVIGEMALDVGRYQSSLLPGLVEKLLSFVGFTLTDIDAVATTIGPGYFTGVRVGLSYAMTLAFGLEVPVIPILSLKALACDFLFVKNVVVIPVIWARGHEYYASAFESNGNDFIEIIEPKVIEEKELHSMINGISKRRSEQIFVIGDDVVRFRAKPEGACLVPNSTRGSNVAKLGFRFRSEAKCPSKIRALYLREPYS